MDDKYIDMRRDDILLNEIYGKLNVDILIEGIIQTAKDKISSVWKNPFRKYKEDIDSDIVSVLSAAAEKLKRLGVNPEDYLSPKTVRGMVTPPNWSAPSNASMSTEPTPTTTPPKIITKPPVVSVNSKPTPSIPQKKSPTAIYSSVKPGELRNILKGKDPMGYKVPDDLKDPKTNKMTGPEVMEYLGVDMEELNYLVAKLKAFSFKKDKIDASDVEGSKYLRIQQALKDREDSLKTATAIKPAAIKKPAATKKPAVTKKPAAAKKPTVAKKPAKK